MNIQILFIAIYRALECLEEETGNAEISAYLDKANPYVFKDRKSADPVIFNEFVKWIEEKKIHLTLDNSYETARKYISENTSFIEIFNDIDSEEWHDLIDIIKDEEPQLVEESCE
ncbi:MAG: hypothetical protein Q4E57_06335 [Eubacteriales bacterium]|nr:hypothetical protein [Eubacteriales bacterium]